MAATQIGKLIALYSQANSEKLSGSLCIFFRDIEVQDIIGKRITTKRLRRFLLLKRLRRLLYFAKNQSSGADIHSISNQRQLVTYISDASQLMTFMPQTTLKEGWLFELIQTSLGASINAYYFAIEIANNGKQFVYAGAILNTLKTVR